jgi:hypothetical protein
VNPTVFSAGDAAEKLRAGSAFLQRVLRGNKTMIYGDSNVLERLAG